MKKTVSKITVAVLTTAMALTSMMSISASANDGMRYNSKTTEVATAGSSMKYFVSGIWYSTATAEGIKCYNFDSNTMTGNVYTENTGVTETFTYSYDGYTLTLYYADGTVSSAVIAYNNSDSMTVYWATGCIDSFTSKYPYNSTAGTSAKNFVSGTWYSTATVQGTMRYNFDSNKMTGNVYNVSTGKTKTFTYSYDGYTLTLYYADGTVSSGSVAFGKNSMTITWSAGCIDPLTPNYIENNKIVATGDWYSSDTADGVIDYHFNIGKQSGSLYKEWSGKSLTFTYNFDGDNVNFFYSDGTVSSAKVTFGSNEMTFKWATGCIETFKLI